MPGGRGRQPRVVNGAGDRPDERDISELCHDLRQPIATLVQLAAASTAELAGPARERMAQIARETRRLCGMVQSVLAAPAVWEPVDLAGIAREVVQSVRTTYGGELDLSAPGPAPVIGQRAQLDRVLSNLIENAAHAGRGLVHVEVRTTDGRVRVSVDDDGPGLLRSAG